MKNRLNEAGVDYTFDDSEAEEFGYKAYNYDVYFLGQKIWAVNTVYCRREEDFEKLLPHWSRDDKWQYEKTA